MNTTAPARAVTITNTGASAATVSSVTASGNFAVSHDCTSIAPAASCVASTTFTPGAEGPIIGTITFVSDAGTQTVQLAGIGERSLATHYYLSILRRAPDSGGKAFWVDEAGRLAPLGISVNETWFAMALEFYRSPEYVAFDRDDAGFVTDLYKTFFNRAPDAGGLGYWTSLMAAGMPREVVLTAFMFSGEFASFTQSIFGNTAARAEVDMVVDFYRGLLKRLPDSSGFGSWRQQLRLAQCGGAAQVVAQVESISSAFALSQEYLQRGRSDAEYVGDLYNSFLRRGGDLAGAQFWIDEISSGRRSREQVRRDFIQQPEFQARVAAVIAQGCLGTSSGNFSFVKAATIGAPNSAAQVSIQRLAGDAGAYDLYYSLIGEGCAVSETVGPVRFEDRDTSSKTVSVPLSGGGVCSAILVTPSGVIGTQRAIAITVVPVVAGCPASQEDVVLATPGGLGNPLLQRQRSQQVMFLALPATSGGRASGMLIFSESAGGAYTPQPVTLEISISKCPGVIGTDYANFCNLRSTNSTYNSITWFSREGAGINSGNAPSKGYCWAGDGGQYYANARWTYSSCPLGVETCGFAIQVNDGPF